MQQVYNRVYYRVYKNCTHAYFTKSQVFKIYEYCTVYNYIVYSFYA